MSSTSYVSRVQRVRHDLKLRQLTVSRVQMLSPHVRSVTFSGPELAGFVSASFDDHLKLLLPVAPGSEPARRDYTPRHHDAAAQELTLEFALHGHGPAADWAAQAAVGQTVSIGGPRGSMIIPSDYAWHWLVGDESALPAIARRLEELPAGVPVRVLVQVTDPADRRALASKADVDITWVHSTAACLAAVQSWEVPAGEGFAWCAGEAGTMAALRHLLLTDKGLDKGCVRAAAYWKRGVQAHHETLDDAPRSPPAGQAPVLSTP
jgi:NADPH-dependent ferric siderophore reductase